MPYKFFNIFIYNEANLSSSSSPLSSLSLPLLLTPCSLLYLSIYHHLIYLYLISFSSEEGRWRGRQGGTGNRQQQAQAFRHFSDRHLGWTKGTGKEGGTDRLVSASSLIALMISLLNSIILIMWSHVSYIKYHLSLIIISYHIIPSILHPSIPCMWWWVMACVCVCY